jgi:hypothetical protein
MVSWKGTPKTPATIVYPSPIRGLFSVVADRRMMARPQQRSETDSMILLPFQISGVHCRALALISFFLCTTS